MNTTKQTAADRPLTNAEKEQKTAALLGAVARGLFYAAIGYFGGLLTLPFGAIPFGIALLAAAGKQAPYMAIGLFLSTARLSHPAIRLCVYGMIFLLRLLFCLWGGKRTRHLRSKKTALRALGRRLFTEPLGLRVLNAVLGAFLLGGLILYTEGFLYYDLYGLLLTVALAPIGVLLFSGLNENRDGTDRERVRYALGSLAVSLTVIFAAGSMSLYGISLAPFFALFLSLAAVKRYGLARGVPASALLGLAVAPALAPLFALAALGAAVLMPLSVSLASTVALIIGIAYGYSVRGLDILNGLFPALLAAGLLFSVTDKLFLHIGEKKREREKDTDETATREEERIPCEILSSDALSVLQLRETEQKLQRLSSGFDALSRELADYSARLTLPERSDYALVCEEAFRCCCSGCPEQALCYGEKLRQTQKEIRRLGDLLEIKGQLNHTDISAFLTERCARLPDILDEMNHHASLCGAVMERGRRAEQFSEDYGGVAALIAETLQSGKKDFRPDLPLSRALTDAINRGRFGIRGAAVTGTEARRTLCLRGADQEELEAPSEEFRALCRQVLPFTPDFGRAETVCLSKDPPLFESRIPQRECVTVKCAVKCAAAEGEGEPCGDNAQVFHGNRHEFFSCISDGMGSGREAAEASALSGKLLQNLLVGGSSVRSALTLLNCLLRHRGNGSLHECSATVDLLRLDLIAGRATFYKCGAAPTYILRGGSLVKLRSGTLPVGIMKRIDVGVIPCEVTPGDVIVMVSDGVTQGKEECPGLFELLQARAATSDPATLASLILNDAKKRGSSDDISVAVIQIKSA